MMDIPSDAIHEESDTETDSVSPILDRFYANGGSKTLLEMSNFTMNEFERLWQHCCQTLTEKMCLGCGKKPDVSPKDLLFSSSVL